jgi:hypothetical protein
VRGEGLQKVGPLLVLDGSIGRHIHKVAGAHCAVLCWPGEPLFTARRQLGI